MAPDYVERHDWMTRKDVAAYFKISLRSVDRWVKEGCPSEVWGLRVRRFDRLEVERWLRSR